MPAAQPTRWLRAAPCTLRQAFLPRYQTRGYHPTLSLRSAGDVSPAQPATPALLSSLKQDLKTAMRSKDAPRLAVLRSVITTANNAAKTTSPIATDVQLVALLRKQLRASHASIDEANQNGRPDLAEKEQAQAKVLEEYIAGSGVVSVTEAELSEMIHKISEDTKAAGLAGKELLGKTMKAVTDNLRGKDLEVEMKQVTEMVKKSIGR